MIDERRGLAHVVGAGLEGEAPERDRLPRQAAQIAPRCAARGWPSGSRWRRRRLRRRSACSRRRGRSAGAPSRPSGSRSRRSRFPGTGTTDPMRVSEPIPRRTCRTSAPTLSQRFAISFMNEMRVASIALAAYFVSSAEAWSMTRIGWPVRTKGSYSSRMIASTFGSSVPMTTRSGFRKSSTAAPSFRNSGFETTANGLLRHAPAITLADPGRRADRDGGLRDDDLPAVHGAADGLGDRHDVREVGRAVLVLGRPTAMNRISLSRPTPGRSVVKRSRSSATLRGIISSSPGS